MKRIYNKIYDYFKKNYKILLTDIIFVIVIYFLCFFKLPYLIYRPGGAISINEKLPEKYQDKINGIYSMNYVSVSKENVINIILSLFIKNWDIVKEDDASFNNLDYETSLKIEKLEFENSIALANIIAYKKTGNDVNVFDFKKVVTGISDKADTNIKVLDEIISIDGKTFNSNQEIKNYINSLNIGDKVTIKVKRNDKEIAKYAKIYEEDNYKYMGISFIDKYNYKAKPVIKISKNKNEAGPSGGLMLTLTLYDLLSSDDLAKGRNVMGTGTIESDESVGEIGGIKYKLLGAQRKAADIFFVPKNNYEEALEVYQENNLTFKLVMVEKLDDAINYLLNN